jgi:retron-type reverse transcriptase
VDDPLFYCPPTSSTSSTSGPPRKRNLLNNIFNESPFTLDDLNHVLKRAKRGKACGPDGIPMEFFKLLDEESRGFVLTVCNGWWGSGDFPKEKLKAFVASIYKKGDPLKTSNYRPISLLSVIYKTYASLIQKRLAEAIDDDIQNTQYGFRKARSTSHPLACVRRLLERAEASKNPMCFTFLDWEKAFDRIKQDKLLEALERMGLPRKYLAAIQSLYNDPMFAVKVGQNQSEWKKQQAGIRQGCPLSPYLFVIVMTVIFRDVHDDLNLTRGTVDGLSFTELLYADDTVLITNNVNAMNRLLRNVERCARYHGLNFNKDKCVSMNFHCDAKTKYADGTKVPCGDAVTYLGAELTKLGSSRKEVNRKISQCIVICKKLQMFWKNPSCPTKFKLHIYDAVIRSKLVYGLESLHLNAGTLSHLNAFQLKGIRRILNLKHTFVDRSNTNHKVFQMANAIKNPKQIEGKDVVKFSS